VKVAGGATATIVRQAPAGGLPWVNAALLLLVLGSALGVVYSTHLCRQLYASLQLLEASHWHLQEDYGRLLLEHSTWASHHRIEQVAASQLQMASPGLAELRLVRP
jgi:cell division protein FtsL